MGYLKRCLMVFLVFILGVTTCLKAQNDTSGAKVDSTFEKYMNSAWDTLRNADMSDSLQSVYSREFYEYYRQNPQSQTGKDALAQAFMMWGNTGNARYLDEALQTLDYDSEVWGKIVNPMSNIYYRNDSLDLEMLNEKLVGLKEKLRDPESKSAVILSLLRDYMAENKQEKAMVHARQLVEIEASEFFTEQGRGYLHELKSLNIGQPAPDFSSQTISGEEITLSELEGQYVLLDFWATWCGPCLPEIPHLKTLWEKYGETNFEIVAISLDRDKKELTDFIDERNLEWPQILAQKGWEGEIPEKYNVVGIPRTYLLDPEGKIVAKDLRGTDMIKEIKSHLGN